MSSAVPIHDVRAPEAAEAVLAAFVSLRARFDFLTGRAAAHFAAREWRAGQRAAPARLLLYNRQADVAVTALRTLLGERLVDRSIWPAINAAYAACIRDRGDREIAATFFNSVTRRVFGTIGVDAQMEFLGAALEVRRSSRLQLVVEPLADGSPRAVTALLRAIPLGARWEDQARDARRMAAVLDDDLPRAGVGTPQRLEVLASPFYRNKGAYLVGRVVGSEGAMPVVVALLHGERGITVDAVLTTSDEASIVFGFSWSYFQVAVGDPRPIVDFLHGIMPRKRVDELYTAIGFHKHGKTELYRTLRAHLAADGERFERAPGKPGLVMTVIALPRFNLVLKIIRDSFGYPKRVTRREVLAQYRAVFLRDRVGRLADAQEFERLELPRSAFPDDLLAELRQSAPSTVLVDGDDVVIGHCYAQRCLDPLDVYLQTATPEAATAAIGDYGQAIEDLAHAGIFPGDMLLKNFGLSRHGRVIFYDYDEVTDLDDMVFRHLPEGDVDDELSAEPWFSVGENDVFPEEFVRFLVPDGALRKAFIEAHGALFTPEWWSDVQQRVRQGELFDVYPYAPSRRLALRGDGGG